MHFGRTLEQAEPKVKFVRRWNAFEGKVENIVLLTKPFEGLSDY